MNPQPTRISHRRVARAPNPLSMKKKKKKKAVEPEELLVGEKKTQALEPKEEAQPKRKLEESAPNMEEEGVDTTTKKRKRHKRGKRKTKELPTE